MSDFSRQREALLSGFAKQTVTVPAVGMPSTTVLGVPVGNPMGGAGTQRNAPTPFLSVYAGLRPHTDFNRLFVAGNIQVLVEVGILPYLTIDVPAARQPRPLFVPLNDANSGFITSNVLGQKALLPWPPGSLQVRVSFEWFGTNSLGDEVDVCVAWAAVSLAAYIELPTVQDAFDLQSSRYRQ